MTGRHIRVAGLAAALGIAMIPLMAACSLLFPTNPFSSPVPGPRDGELVAVPTAPPLVPDENGAVICLGALLSGVLVSHPEWGITVGGGAGEPPPVFWPNGFVGRIVGDRIELLDRERRVVARTGDRIEAGGGGTTIDGVVGFGVCPGTIEVQPAEP
jgi:hypothetical protein